MKFNALLVLTPFIALAACGRSEPPISATEPAPGYATEAPAPAGAVPALGAGVGTAAATVTLSGAAVNGSLQFSAVEGGVQMTGEITGLTASSEHGFHVHQTGDCTAPDFKSAGDHFNPTNAPHGASTSAAHHLGDLASIKSNAEGTATVSGTVAGATLRDGGPHDLVGKALIVHAKRDDYTTQPSGDSGDRIACGVIQGVP